MVGVDRSEEGLKELPDGIRREAADPTDQAAARSVVDRIAAEVGPPEVLVNTIGMFHPGDALTATPEDLRLMIDVNVGAALWLTQAVVPYQRDRGRAGQRCGRARLRRLSLSPPVVRPVAADQARADKINPS